MAIKPLKGFTSFRHQLVDGQLDNILKIAATSLMIDADGGDDPAEVLKLHLLDAYKQHRAEFHEQAAAKLRVT